MARNNRQNFELRRIKFKKIFILNAIRLVLAICGNIQVICSAFFSKKIPNWLRNNNELQGWSAEYCIADDSQNFVEIPGRGEGDIYTSSQMQEMLKIAQYVK